jgi:hypothetical protein
MAAALSRLTWASAPTLRQTTANKAATNRVRVVGHIRIVFLAFLEMASEALIPILVDKRYQDPGR